MAIHHGLLLQVQFMPRAEPVGKPGIVHLAMQDFRVLEALVQLLVVLEPHIIREEVEQLDLLIQVEVVEVVPVQE